MTDFAWEPSQQHPPAGLLLLHLERELSDREAAAVDRHIAQCWQCRTQSHQLKRGIYAFIQYRNERLVPSVPQPPTPRYASRQRLYPAASLPEPWPAAVLRCLVQPRANRYWWAAVTALAVVAAIAIASRFAPRPGRVPPEVTAAELLRHASAVRPGIHAAIYQTVEIRYAGHTSRHEFLRRRGQSIVPRPPRNLPRLMPVDWSDPLGAEQFALWRNTLTSRRDSVDIEPDTMTLNTATLVPAEIASASLTVRRSDWRPIAKKVDLAGGSPLEIRELSYEVRAETDPLPSLAVSRPAPGAAPRHAPPDEERLEFAEVELREALHRIEADIRETPRIWREGNRIHFSSWAEDAERAAALRLAASGIPEVRAEIRGPGSAAGGTITESSSTPSTAAAIVSTPPLRDRLWKLLGGIESANRYLNEESAAYLKLFATASALARLAGRYPEATRGRLPATVTDRVDRLAAEQIAGVREHARHYLDRTDFVLHDMLASQNISLPTTPEPSGCVPWQEAAPALAADIRSLHLSFRRLFVPDQVDEPIDFSPSALLRQAADAEWNLMSHLSRICPPGRSLP